MRATLLPRLPLNHTRVNNHPWTKYIFDDQIFDRVRSLIRNLPAADYTRDMYHHVNRKELEQDR